MSTRSLLEKKYMKIFVSGVILLIVGIFLLMAGRIYTNFAEYNTMEEMQAYLRVRGFISTFMILFLTLGFAIFTLSTFMGGVVDDSLSPDVRRGMIFASSIAIIALALILIFSGIII